MRILVTGSHGFIGSHLVKKLTEDGHDVYSADKKIGIDLCDLDIINRLPDVDVVFHAAAFNGTKFFYDRPYDVIRNNILPTQYLLDRYAGKCSKFIFAGTCESYASSIDMFGWPVPTTEQVPLTIADVTNERWSYGGSKIVGELMCVAALKQFKQPYTIIRYHNVYGPGQVDHFIPEFVQKIRKGQVELIGYNNTRSFMYISDAVSATIKIINSDKCNNEILNVGINDEVTIKEVAKIILDIENIKDTIVLKESPVGSVTRRCPDVSKLHTLIDFSPTVSLREGLKLTMEQI